MERTAPITALQALTEHREVKDSLEIRPLGNFSNFVAKKLCNYNHALAESGIIDGCEVTPDLLFTTLEQLISEVPEITFQALESTEKVGDRRVALIDLLFAIRSLDIAYKGNEAYTEKLEASKIFQYANQLATIEGRLPTLQWVDTAIYYPYDDPRSFLANTPQHPTDRDQEVALYRTNGAIDGVFKSIVESNLSEINEGRMDQVNTALQLVVDGMRTLSQTREVGNFDRLSEFSGPKIDNVIIASGSFSAWTHLVGWLLTGDQTFRERLIDERNGKYFDQDALPYIKLLKENNLPTFRDHIAHISDDGLRTILTGQLNDATHTYMKFILTHRGAVKKHAPNELTQSSPTNNSISNLESINAAIAALQQARVQ